MYAIDLDGTFRVVHSFNGEGRRLGSIWLKPATATSMASERAHHPEGDAPANRARIGIPSNRLPVAARRHTSAAIRRSRRGLFLDACGLIHQRRQFAKGRIRFGTIEEDTKWFESCWTCPDGTCGAIQEGLCGHHSSARAPRHRRPRHATDECRHIDLGTDPRVGAPGLARVIPKRRTP